MKSGPRDEEEWERLDRNLDELLQELRIALPGVQVLFAFLLAVPFQQRFEQVTAFQKYLYFATLLLAAGSMFLLMAPTAFHRLTFRRQQKAALLRLSNRLSIAGLALLSLAVVGAVTLITDFLFDSSAATVVVCALSLGGAFATWFLVPLLLRARTRTS